MLRGVTSCFERSPCGIRFAFGAGPGAAASGFLAFLRAASALPAGIASAGAASLSG
ncbi:hypothetical protein [Paenibacillus tuaregi]|uniref:hypothetical protein n=1 Tax=Paenibacillus tuaregi TaxID=1816681 RepID=UPI0012FE2CC9|nr:hypothetical protein [Paenibacillus tuaregi]